MELKFTGFCTGCNCFSKQLKLRPVKNNNTGSLEVGMFCNSCIERFGIYPYDKDKMQDAKPKEGESQRTVSRNEQSADKQNRAEL